MQIEISDDTYRKIQSILDKQGSDVSAFADGALSALADRLAQHSTGLPAELQQVVEEIRRRGPSEPLPGPDNEDSKSQLQQSIDRLQACVSDIDPHKLQESIDATVEQVEADYRAQAMNATLG